ncbi:hypothetical protein DPMN_075146 [Dreissena polymorpha]|uniref:Uncharacterized protein n=1 Tax=Dreissena polymorpha TaxID=45954 RepID=A0A9D3YJT4_DREPO|nr:hypothetical protein DPMN_075146 [Dreissena polymorpha]
MSLGARAQSRVRAARGPGLDPARIPHPSTKAQTAPPLERLLKQRLVIPELCVQVVNGGYTSWSSWGTCSVTCASGIWTRSRSCSNPAPQHKGADCTSLGAATETSSCNTGIMCPSEYARMLILMLIVDKS